MQDLKYPINKFCSMHFWAFLFVSYIVLFQIGLLNFSYFFTFFYMFYNFRPNSSSAPFSWERKYQKDQFFWSLLKQSGTKLRKAEAKEEAETTQWSLTKDIQKNVVEMGGGVGPMKVAVNQFLRSCLVRGTLMGGNW